MSCPDGCLERKKKHEQAIADYKSAWPNFCRKCNGWGGHAYDYDPSPAGVCLAPGTMTDFDPCPHCIEKGICPRCGGVNPDPEAFCDEDYACIHCGWVQADGGRPRDWCEECDQWMDEVPNKFDAIEFYRETCKELEHIDLTGIYPLEERMVQ